MGYQEMADGLRDLLIGQAPASTKVKDGNSSAKNDWRVMNEPGVNLSFIFSPGPAQRDLQTQQPTNNKETVWDIHVNAVAKYGKDVEVHDLLVGATQDIMDTVDKFPLLNGVSGVYIAEFISADEPIPLFTADGRGPMALMRVLTVQVTESVDIDTQE